MPPRRSGAGVRLLLRTRVTGVTAAAGEYRVGTTRGPLRCRWLVNAAGLDSDQIDRMLGSGAFTITPRRGELIVFDKLARPLVSSILLPVPTARTKGVLIAPTVYGNLLLGPTAEDVPSRADTATTGAGLAGLLGAGQRIVPALAGEEVTATYAGLRAATEHRDYQIRVDEQLRYACVGGIRSTGLSASLGIAEYVVEQFGAAGLKLTARETRRAARHAVPRGGRLRPYQDAAGSPPTRSTAGSSATASGSPAARSATPWPARCPRPTWTACAAAPAPPTAAARASIAAPRWRACCGRARTEPDSRNTRHGSRMVSPWLLG